MGGVLGTRWSIATVAEEEWQEWEGDEDIARSAKPKRQREEIRVAK